MQEFTEIKKVTFSGKFPLQLSDADLKECRSLIIDVQVLRKPTSAFLSKKTNPENGFLGTFCLMSANLVVKRYDIDFVGQRYIFEASTDTQIIPSLLCILEQETINLRTVAQSLGVTVSASPVQYFQDLRPIFPVFDSLLFQCYADTAFSVTVQKLKYEKCDFGFDDIPPNPKPLPTPPPDQIPPGQPVPPDIYTPSPPGAGDDYEPFPGDNAQIDPPPIPLLCSRFVVSYRIFAPNNPGEVLFSGNREILGAYEGTYLDDPVLDNQFGSGIIGGMQTPDGCVPGNKYELIVTNGPGIIIIVDSVEPLQ